MNTSNLTFTANDQELVKNSGLEEYASNSVSYIKATFTLGENWSGFDSVRAVWSSYYNIISTVLDTNNSCLVPAEMLLHKSEVKVNLVGSIVENNVLTDRLTTFPIKALKVSADAQVNGTETAPVSPSQFEQFVNSVEAAAQSVTDYSHDSEAWAKGTRGGTAVSSSDPTYHNNSKYWNDQGAALSQEVTNLKSDIECQFTTESGYLTENGTIASASAYNEVTSSFIPVLAGLPIHFKLRYPNASSMRWCAYCIFDANHSILGQRTVFLESAVDSVDQTIIVPSTFAGVAYIRFSWRTQTGYSARISTENIFTETVSTRKRLETLESATGFLDNVTWETGGIDGSGKNANANRIRSSYIPLSALKSLKIKIAYNYRIAYHYYTSNTESSWVYGKWWYTNEVDLSGSVDYVGGYVRICLAYFSDNILPTADDILLIGEPKKVSINTALFNQFLPANSKRYIYAKGNSWDYLWNTIEAYESAGQDSKCWGISGDVQFTYDGYLVMYHDPKVLYNGNEVTITSLNLSQVQSITLTKDGVNYSIPTFEEFIAICRKYGKFCVIETKAGVAAYPWTSNGHASEFEKIISKVYELGMQDSVAFAVPNADLNYLRTNYPMLGRITLLDGSVTTSTVVENLNDPQTMPSGYANAWDSSGLISTVHKWGRKILMYGTRPQTQTDIDAMVNLGADAVFVFIEPN